MLLLFCSEHRLRARQFVLRARQGLPGARQLGRFRLGLSQPLLRLRQVLLQSGFTLLTLHQRCLGVSQLLLHGRQRLPCRVLLTPLVLQISLQLSVTGHLRLQPVQLRLQLLDPPAQRVVRLPGDSGCENDRGCYQYHHRPLGHECSPRMSRASTDSFMRIANLSWNTRRVPPGLENGRKIHGLIGVTTRCEKEYRRRAGTRLNGREAEGLLRTT